VGLPQDGNQVVDAVPVVLHLEVVAPEVPELEQLRKPRVGLVVYQGNASVLDLDSHFVEQVCMPPLGLEAVLEVLRDSQHDGLEACVVVLDQSGRDECRRTRLPDLRDHVL